MRHVPILRGCFLYLLALAMPVAIASANGSQIERLETDVVFLTFDADIATVGNDVVFQSEELIVEMAEEKSGRMRPPVFNARYFINP